MVILVWLLLNAASSLGTTVLSDHDITKLLKSPLKGDASHITDEMMLDYAYGNETDNANTDIDIGLLESDNLKQVVATATRKFKLETESRQAYYGGIKYATMCMDLMKQSIYSTRYRLEATRPFRLKHGGDPVYQIGLLYGSLLQLRLKMINLFNTMYRFQYFVKFLWFLVTYERILVLNIDVESMVERIFVIHKGMTDEGDDDYGPDPTTTVQDDAQKRP